MDVKTEVSPTAEATRRELIAAGISLFGELGYRGTSVRALTQKAGVNIAAIQYHFGGKDGLFEACVDTVAYVLSEAGPGQFLPVDESAAAQLCPNEATRLLRTIIQSVIMSAFDPDRTEYVKFLHGQVVIEGRGLDRFVQTTLRRHHQIFTVLVARAEGREPDSDVTRTRAMVIMMQTISIVRSQKMLALMLGWTTPSDRATDLVDAIYPIPPLIPKDPI